MYTRRAYKLTADAQNPDPRAKHEIVIAQILRVAEQWKWSKKGTGRKISVDEAPLLSRSISFLFPCLVVLGSFYFVD